jgi:mRNA-degrading endonuclease RelE of RelBE toxin-antitoxin system
MQWTLAWDPRVPEGLRALPAAERQRVLSTILSLADDPMPAGARSLPGKPHWFRLDDGPFCILYAVDRVESSVTVYAVMKDEELLGPDRY